MNTRKKNFILIIISISIGLGSLLYWGSQTVLRITNYKSGEIYVEVPAKEGDKLFFGWIHSWEKIPWNEYYHIAHDNTLVLDTISFPAFGAGIPENKGKVCRIENGLIYMDEINQVFPEFDWINSHFSTREIILNGQLISKGDRLPEHTRLRLFVERRWKRWIK
ncbi:hypothetical protein SDC9_43206 [bioreactor metagenome]|jgi:Uncharacterized conserved protein|uniref:DUF1850 domain-containing protein n=1 Tax=bioreactor metagenome TaxID=1076179 RepID=A0A644VZX8_9ZZZZ|nr:DUF1850 domain-containing protein [Acidaminococcaceae bacterium]